MQSFADIKRNPSRRDRLGLGAALLCGGLALLLHHHLRGRPSLAVPLAVALAVLAVAAQLPGIGSLIYIGWMGLGIALGRVTSPVVLALLYALLFVPLGLLFRLLGRDPMQRRLDPQAASYWVEHPEAGDVRSLLRQY